MSTLERHRIQYQRFREDAEREDLNKETRVEAYFLAAFHLIDACAAKYGVHINKHQRVRRELEANDFIFGEDTDAVWQGFQELESRLRPKFVYGFRWTSEDFEEVQGVFSELEKICEERFDDA